MSGLISPYRASVPVNVKALVTHAMEKVDQAGLPFGDGNEFESVCKLAPAVSTGCHAATTLKRNYSSNVIPSLGIYQRSEHSPALLEIYQGRGNNAVSLYSYLERPAAAVETVLGSIYWMSAADLQSLPLPRGNLITMAGAQVWEQFNTLEILISVVESTLGALHAAINPTSLNSGTRQSASTQYRVFMADPDFSYAGPKPRELEECPMGSIGILFPHGRDLPYRCDQKSFAGISVGIFVRARNAQEVKALVAKS